MNALRRHSPLIRRPAAERPDEVRDLLRLMERTRSIQLRPGDPIQSIVAGHRGRGLLSVELLPGIYDLRSSLVLSASQVALWSRGCARLHRTVVSTAPMVDIQASFVVVDGLWLDDDVGSGHAIAVRSTAPDATVQGCVVLAGPGGGVAVGDGVNVAGAARTMVNFCRVTLDASRPNGAIWFDDPATNGSIVGNQCSTDVISYLGVSGTVSGANIGNVIVR